MICAGGAERTCFFSAATIAEPYSYALFGQRPMMTVWLG